MRCQAEEKVNQLQNIVQESRKDNQKLEQSVREWKLVAEQYQSNIVKYSDGMSRFSILLAELKLDIAFN
jgi:hypothetical protein